MRSTSPRGEKKKISQTATTVLYHELGLVRQLQNELESGARSKYRIKHRSSQKLRLTSISTDKSVEEQAMTTRK